MQNTERPSSTPLTSRQTLIALSVSNSGDWDAIYKTIVEKKLMDKKYIIETAKRLEDYAEKINGRIIVMTDSDYPCAFTTLEKPPFVIYIANGVVSTIPFDNKKDN